MKDSNNYVVINKEHIPVSKHLYREIKKFENRERIIAVKEHRCSRTEFKSCSADCSGCPFYCDGLVVSLDVNLPDRNPMFRDPHNMEDLVESADLMNSVYAFAGHFTVHGSEIMRKYCEEGLSKRQIAVILGISHTMVNKEFDEIMKRLREMKNFF